MDARRMARRWCPVALLPLALAGCADLFGGGEPEGESMGWIAWSVPVRSGYDGRPAVDAARVYFEGDTGMAAFDQATGARVWEPRLRDGGYSKNVVLREGRLFAAEAEVVRAYDAATGAVLWRVTPPGSGDLSETAADDRAVYIGTRTHRVLALDPGNGHTIWDVDVGAGWEHEGIVTGVAVSGDTVYAAVRRFLVENGYQAASVIVALDRTTSRELWRLQTEGVRGYPGGAPVVSGNLLVVSDAFANAVFAVDRGTGREVWRTPFDAGYVGPNTSPVIVGGVAYVGSGDTYVYAVDVATGRRLWRTRTGSSIRHLGVCGDRVVVSNYDIEIVDRKTGKHLGVALTSTDTEFATSGVAVWNGRAFVAGSQKLYAIRCD